MYRFTIARAKYPRRTVRSLTAFVLLSSPWVIASAAPVLSGTPVTSVVAAHYYAFQPSAYDSSGKALTFSIVNKPSWAQFDTTTGRLYGTPLPQSNVGTYSNISISASDGAARATLAPFSVQVLPLANSPPRIGGSPTGTVVVGKAYSFQPSATDPNGLSVKFGIWNKPSWATFDGNTGRLSGTPVAGNVGSYSNIVITAYDGYLKASLPAFAIVVQAAATTAPPVSSPPVAPPTTTGSATLSWNPPTQNSNGSVLANLAGYHIYYGTNPNNLTQTVTLANPGLTRYVISGLSSSSWYFAMTAYNTAGVESARTGVATIAVQ